MEPLYKGHIGTLETVLYIEIVLNSEVIVQWNLSIEDTLGPYFRVSFVRGFHCSVTYTLTVSIRCCVMIPMA